MEGRRVACDHCSDRNRESSHDDTCSEAKTKVLKVCEEERVGLYRSVRVVQAFPKWPENVDIGEPSGKPTTRHSCHISGT